jgi:dipeptidyl aminopeptidase/acylaminoacyl peptidase
MKSLIWRLLGICVLCTTVQAQTERNNRFSVAMSIEMTTFSDPYTRDPAATSKMSPDGRYFVVVTTRGWLSSNRLESRVLVYSSQQVRRYLEGQNAVPPGPRQLFTLSKVPEALQSNSYGSLITGIQWASDSQSVLALVEMPQGRRHLFRICVTCQRPARDLTPGPQVDVRSFSESSGTLAYVGENQPAAHKGGPIGRPINARASVITDTTLYQVLAPELYPDPDNAFPSYELWTNREGQRWRVLGKDGRYFPGGAGSLHLAVSPDGNYLIAAQPVQGIPESWSNYKSARTMFSFRADSLRDIDRSGRSRGWPWQYTIIGLEKKTSQPLVAAPSSFLSSNGDAFEAVWSKDQKRVVFTGSYLELERAASDSDTDLRNPCAAAIYDVAEKRASCIAFTHFPKEYLRHAEFGASDREVRLRWLKDGQIHTELYQESGGAWSQHAEGADTREQDKLTLSLHQALDSPPELWAVDNVSHTTKPLFDPNPQLRRIHFGEAKVYRWKDKSGYVWEGGLVLPPNYVSGRRYPLVIQTHGFYNEKEFLADGSFTTGFAAQPLASEDIIVLQMGDRADRYTYPPTEEAALQVAGFKSAIEHLSADGLIDESRVGIIGFSRTHWYVESALIDCPHCFKAATLIDGVDQSYVSDILFSTHMPNTAIEDEAANGAKPFGPGLKQWVERAPGFNLDKIVTPVRIEASGKFSVLGEWEIYSLLTRQNKPVDFIYIPEGQHILQAPLDRYASQQGDVDWFRFWLNGDEAPSYANESERWDKFRKLYQLSPHEE